MTFYDPPLADIRAALTDAAGLDEIAALPGCEAADTETVTSVLDEAARFAREVLAPLDRVGDRNPARLENGTVVTPPGFRDAYRAFVEAGWNGLAADPAAGGQGLPAVVAAAVSEMWQGANLAFGLCPLLTFAAIEAIHRHGTDEQRATYLAKLVSGEWTGTMNLTEPQAGSDVGALRTRAVPAPGPDGGESWRLFGQKIFITYGEHDFTDNIIHLVLARTPGAPSGTRGISMFIVPKFLVNPDGTLGDRNDVRAVGLEHKLGLHASPTATLAYGEDDGAIGFMLGTEHRGMENMFTMMNGARLGVGLQGVALASRAYQQALAYARTRMQGRPIGAEDGAPIVFHPDVRRMLLRMKATSEAARALAYYAAAQSDRARHAPDETARAAAQVRLDLLIPLVKAWSTDVAVESASLAVQIHGGAGFIEETGIAQAYRDCRILPIYEGTNGIQAMDLIGRKLARDTGAAVVALRDEIATILPALSALPAEDATAIRHGLEHGLSDVAAATEKILALHATAPAAAAAAGVPYLRLLATVTGLWLLAKQAVAAVRRQDDETKTRTARFFAEAIVPSTIRHDIDAACTVAAFPPDLL